MRVRAPRARAPRWMFPLGLAVVLLTLLASCATRLVNHFAFYPDRETHIPDANLPAGVRRVMIDASDGERIECLHLRGAASGPAAGRLAIYFHGNAGNIGHRLPELQQLASFGADVLGVGYRGYGRSTGRPSERGIQLDGAAALQHARDALGFRDEQIILVGRSIGTTVAVHHAVDRPFAGVVLITPLTSGREMARQMGIAPLGVFVGNVFDNLGHAPRMRAPVLVIHGTRDEVIPYDMGVRLHAAVTAPKRLITLEGGGHNDLEYTAPEKFWTALREFFADPRSFTEER